MTVDEAIQRLSNMNLYEFRVAASDHRIRYAGQIQYTHLKQVHQQIRREHVEQIRQQFPNVQLPRRQSLV